MFGGDIVINRQGRKVLIIAFLAEGSVLVLALVMALHFELELFPLSDNYVRDVVLATAGASPPFVLFLYTLSAGSRRTTFFSSLRKIVVTDIKDLFSHSGPFDLIMISLIAGFAEELFFRGVIQTEYGIIIASAAFGLAHCISLSYVVIATIMGFYMGWLFIFSGNLFVPFFAHFVYDLAALMHVRYVVKAENE